MISNYKIIKKDKMPVSQWSGGETTQLSIFPETKKYKDRNFIWRLSSATVDSECSTFTKLDDYNRIIMVLDGKLELNHNDTEIIYLNQFDQNEFDGSNDTKTIGKCVDFNLMIRKEQGSGKIKAVEIESQSNISLREINGFSSFKNFALGIYCYKESMDFSIEEIIGAKLQEGDFLLVSFSDKVGSVKIDINNASNKNGVAIVTQVFY